MRDFPPIGQMLDINGVTVHAYVEGTGPDLVLIHGASGNLRDFTYRMVTGLSDRYRVIVFDRPGLGYSDAITPDGASLQMQAQILVQAAQQLGADHPIVLGQSFGGAVALAWAVHYPDNISALVTVSAASHPWDTGLSTYYSVLSSRFGRLIVIPLITAFVSDDRIEHALSNIYAPLPMPEGYIDHIGARLTLRRGAMRANALQRAGLLDWITELAPRYDEISVPTEIIHATGDITVGHDIHSVPLSAAIPAAHLTSINSTSHMPHHTHMDVIIDVIDRAATRAGLR